MRSPTRMLVAVSAVLLFGPRPAASEGRPNPYLVQAKVFYQGLEFRSCVKRLEQAAQWKNTPAELLEIELYSGLCKFQLRQNEAAERHFELALQLDPEARLPAYTSPKIVSFFEAVARRLASTAPRPEQRPAPLPDPETAREEEAPESEPERVAVAPGQAPRRTELVPRVVPRDEMDLVEPAPERRRFPAAAVVVGGVGVAAAGVGVFFAVRAKGLEADSHAAAFQSDAVRLHGDAQGAALVANITLATGGALLAAAVVTYFVTR